MYAAWLATTRWRTTKFVLQVFQLYFSNNMLSQEQETRKYGLKTCRGKIKKNRIRTPPMTHFTNLKNCHLD